ncbi:hypothetical protein [Halovulum sp. GXIMD14793]
MRLALILITLPLPALADGVFGTWCADQGSTIGIEAKGVGNFESSFCTFDTEQKDIPRIITPMTCRTTHFDENNKPVVANEDRFSFSARLLGSNRLRVDYDDGKGPAILTRCSE